LSDAALRFDDIAEGELGDVLHFPDVIQLPLFGTKTDTRREGQLAILPVSSEPTSGCAALREGIQVGLDRLLARPADELIAIGRSMTEHLRKRYLAPPPGPSAMATWPDSVKAAAARLYALGVPVHGLPIYGRWLVDELGPATDLLEGIPNKEFVKVARGVLTRAGTEVEGFGTHSFRRGIAAELALRRMARPDIAALLRHRSLTSTQTYILPSAQAATMALTRREAGVDRGRYPAEGLRLPRAVDPRARHHHGPLGHRPAGAGAGAV
jgi:hypothetical protein